MKEEPMNTPIRFRSLAWIVVLPVLLLACSSQAAQPTSQPIHYTLTPPHLPHHPCSSARYLLRM